MVFLMCAQGHTISTNSHEYGLFLLVKLKANPSKKDVIRKVAKYPPMYNQIHIISASSSYVVSIPSQRPIVDPPSIPAPPPGPRDCKEGISAQHSDILKEVMSSRKERNSNKDTCEWYCYFKA